MSLIRAYLKEDGPEVTYSSVSDLEEAIPPKNVSPSQQPLTR